MNNMPQRNSLEMDGFVLNGDGLSVVTELEQMIGAVACISNMRVINFTCSFIEEDLEKLGGQVFKDEGGVSLQALISTSHIAIHCWPNRSLFMFDIVSCKSFSAKDVAAYLMVSLGVYRLSYCNVIRNGRTDIDEKNAIYLNDNLRANRMMFKNRNMYEDETQRHLKIEGTR